MDNLPHPIEQDLQTAPVWLSVTPLEGVEPLQSQMGVLKPLRVPAALRDVLFAEADVGLQVDQDPETAPPLRTYALLDAACWFALPETLEASGLPHKCLFTGKAKEETGEQAPWLVELDETDRFTGALMTSKDEPGGLWDLEMGIYLRTRMDFDTLWSHLRKFTRVQDHQNKWFFFRFWAPSVSTRLLSLGNRPEVEQLVGSLFPDLPKALSIIVLSKDMNAVLTRIAGTAPRTGPPILTETARATMQTIRRYQEFEDLIGLTHRHVNKQMDVSLKDVTGQLRAKRNKLFNMGFWRRDHLAMLCCWEVMLGPDFLETYSDGHVRKLLTTSETSDVAINRIAAFLDWKSDPEADDGSDRFEGKSDQNANDSGADV